MGLTADPKIKNFAVIFLSILLLSTISVVAVQSEQFVFYDNFNNYVAQTYSGRDGPGIWVQESLASATYSISGGAYRIQAGGDSFPKAILDFYRVFSKTWPPSYEGPSDYIFIVYMKIENTGGGVIFRAIPESQERYWKYYRVSVRKDIMKVRLYYNNEKTGDDERIKEVDVPSGVNLNNFFSLWVEVRGSRIQVYVQNIKVIDVSDTRLPTGGVGLSVCKSPCSASFDSAELRILTTTITNTVVTTATRTVTGTITLTTAVPPSTVTTTAIQTVTRTTSVISTVTTTVTGRITVTTTAAAETIRETVTERVTESLTVTAPLQTTTITQTATISGPVSTQTITQTAPSISTVTVTQTAGGLSRCLIATAAFGSEIAPQVQALREFRDGFVMKTFAGENFMKVFNTFYYTWSPYIAQAEYENELLRKLVKISIYPLLWILDLSKSVSEPFSTLPEFAVLLSGLVASFLIGLIYVSPITWIASLIIEKKGRRINLNPVYLLSALTIGLLFYVLAELTASSLFMMAASSIVVLSCMSIASITPVKTVSIIRKLK